MAFKFVSFFALIVACNAGLLPVVQHHQAGGAVLLQGSNHYDNHDSYAPANYEFGYSVQDGHTGDVKSQHEVRHGDAVQGQYSLIEPDGHKRIVDYTADAHHGFNAQVRREGSLHADNSHYAQPIAVAHHAPQQIAIAHHAPQQIAIAHHAPQQIAIAHHAPQQIAIAHHAPQQIAIAHHAPQQLAYSGHVGSHQATSYAHQTGPQYTVAHHAPAQIAVAHHAPQLAYSSNVGHGATAYVHHH